MKRTTKQSHLRTLVSEANAYYVAHGTFGPAATGATWNEVTNVPLSTPTARVVGTGTTPTAHLQAGRQNCIGVRLVNKNGDTPAHIVFTRENADANTVCRQVLDSAPVAVYLRSTVTGVATTAGTSGAMAVGSSRGIYEAAPPVRTTPATVPGTGAPGGGGGGGVGR